MRYESYCFPLQYLDIARTSHSQLGHQSGLARSQVRVQLNEACWLGINGAGGTGGKFAGQPYRDAVDAYVQLLIANGMWVILDLHWAAPGTQIALSQWPAPNQDHSPAFWTRYTPICFVVTFFLNARVISFSVFLRDTDTFLRFICDAARLRIQHVTNVWPKWGRDFRPF